MFRAILSTIFFAFSCFGFLIAFASSLGAYSRHIERTTLKYTLGATVAFVVLWCLSH